MAWSDADGLQGLHWAARQGQTAALQVLLEAGANAEGRWEEVAGTVGRKWLAFFIAMPDKYSGNIYSIITYNIDIYRPIDI